MWHQLAPNATRDAASSTLTESSSVVTPSALSEDVASLLAWGRHVLQAQRQQQRTPSGSLAYADPSLSSSRPPPLLSSAAPASTPVAPEANVHSQRMPSQSLMAVASTSDVLCTAADTPFTLEQARKRLAQLEELEAANARVFERRWALLSLGRERLLRLHGEQREVETSSPRTRQLQRLIVAVQAIVEGEASLEEVLREILRGLAELYEQHHRQDEEDVDCPSLAGHQSSALVESVHAGRSFDFEEDSEAVKSASDSLCRLADAVVRRTRLVLDAHRHWKRARAERCRAAMGRLQRCAESERALRQQLETLKAAVAEATEEEARERRRLVELRARCAAAERAAALQHASALREQAVQEALQNLQLLQQEATLQNAIARQELAAGEARYHQAKAAYDMAITDRHAAEEALAAAQRTYRDSKRRREEAEGALEQARQSLKSASDQCDEVRAQRAQAADDCAAVDEELHRKRRAYDSLLSGEKGAGESVVAAALCLGGSRVASSAAERYAVLQRELLRLEQHLQHGLEEVVSLEQTEAQLRDTLEREKSALDLLRRQKTALEAHLAPPPPRGNRGDEAFRAVARETGTTKPSVVC
ncbi:hypothetical protein JIQ42_07951 [Leishmania sp. Namibia]|uniref:hypothetical protein n=1 Tax=Leishmania sp. Namibia TaxID=2802991 RepID=UPI001B71D0C5|nr:hypothetical protein JIQ42_07951 [Leishmania sp. Namibia]